MSSEPIATPVVEEERQRGHPSTSSATSSSCTSPATGYLARARKGGRSFLRQQSESERSPSSAGSSVSSTPPIPIVISRHGSGDQKDVVVNKDDHGAAADAVAAARRLSHSISAVEETTVDDLGMNNWLRRVMRLSRGHASSGSSGYGMQAAAAAPSSSLLSPLGARGRRKSAIEVNALGMSAAPGGSFLRPPSLGRGRRFSDSLSLSASMSRAGSAGANRSRKGEINGENYTIHKLKVRVIHKC